MSTFRPRNSRGFLCGWQGGPHRGPRVRSEGRSGRRAGVWTSGAVKGLSERFRQPGAFSYAFCGRGDLGRLGRPARIAVTRTRTGTSWPCSRGTSCSHRRTDRGATQVQGKPSPRPYRRWVTRPIPASHGWRFTASPSPASVPIWEKTADMPTAGYDCLTPPPASLLGGRAIHGRSSALRLNVASPFNGWPRGLGLLPTGTPGSPQPVLPTRHREN